MADHDKALRLLGDLVAELQEMDFPDPHHTDRPMTADRLFLQYTVAVRKTIEDHRAYDAHRKADAHQALVNAGLWES